MARHPDQTAGPRVPGVDQRNLEATGTTCTTTGVDKILVKNMNPP